MKCLIILCRSKIIKLYYILKLNSNLFFIYQDQKENMHMCKQNDGKIKTRFKKKEK